MIELPLDEVHLWWTEVDELIDPAIVQACLQMMSPPEVEQHRRFHFEKDRRRYLMTRALVRTTLARYLPVPAAHWAFESSAFGRPAVLNPEAQAMGLGFNLSHTDRFVVLALSRQRELGVDTESTDRQAPLNVARSYFSPAEIHALAQLSPHQQPLRFWELWTFKESYIKARGQGLSLPLDQFSILLPGEGTVHLEIDAALNDDPARWQLWQLRPTPEQLVALCLEVTGSTPVRLVCRQVRPFQDEGRDEAALITRQSHGGD